MPDNKDFEVLWTQLTCEIRCNCGQTHVLREPKLIVCTCKRVFKLVAYVCEEFPVDPTGVVPIIETYGLSVSGVADPQV